MLIFRKNQVVIASLIVVIVCAGYLNHRYNQAKITSTNTENPIGTAYFVENTVEDSSSEEMPVAKINGDYFLITKAERERNRDEQKELLQNMIDNKNTDKEGKTKAQNELLKITQNSQKEVAIESVLKGKGIADVVAFVGDGKADIIIKDTKNTLSTQQAMILDVVISETGLKAENVKISPYKPAE